LAAVEHETVFGLNEKAIPLGNHARPFAAELGLLAVRMTVACLFCNLCFA